MDAPTVPESPVEDEVEIDMSDEGGDMDFEAEESEVEVDDDEGDSYTKKIQKLTGKVAQMLRDKDEPDAELDKYVINSIISAIDWEEIPDEDVEDIIAKIEGEDEEDDALEGGDEEVVDIDMDVEEEPTDEIAESEEKDKEEHEDLDDEEDEEDKDELSNEDLKEKLKHHEDAIFNIKKELKDLDKDEKEDEEDKDEEEKEEKNESKTFSKKQLMETFLKKNANLALKKVLKENQTICEECLGEGCESCEDGEEIEEGLDITNQLAVDAGDDVGFAPQPFGEQEMDVVDAITTGQDFLHATGDLDRDGDQIPNRLDMDNNSDGELDFETFDNGEDFIEIDIESILGNSPAPAEPTTKPGVKPTTRPGKGKPRWKKIPKPGVNPKPKALKERKKPTIKRNGMYR